MTDPLASAPRTSAWSAERRQCRHQPRCPDALAPDRVAAHVMASHPEQGWSLLCNGAIVFDDMGEILPGGRVVPPHHPAHHRMPAAA